MVPAGSLTKIRRRAREYGIKECRSALLNGDDDVERVWSCCLSVLASPSLRLFAFYTAIQSQNVM